MCCIYGMCSQMRKWLEFEAPPGLMQLEPSTRQLLKLGGPSIQVPKSTTVRPFPRLRRVHCKLQREYSLTRTG
uniref:Uncharacterized protein n=1 Tax=Utricularia reniformis TaxID=192314 RepID=A0A1Y0B0F2_9LAMI|nr:hypothetical protein AEK19_MT0661 [Utricularia reniformis]ART30912.1 hypothetical protein AEK19_MT0661 [Utricularia reniformis]